MLRNLAQFRVNFLVVFLGAFTVIGLIKLTSLLPARYYFSFSKLIRGAEDPFLVQEPSVSGRKLCALMEKYRLTEENMDSIQVDCSLNKDTRVMDAEANAVYAPLRPEEKDKIYEIALTKDAELRAKIAEGLKRLAFAIKTDAQVRKLADEAGTPSGAFTKLVATYESQIDKNLTTPVAEYFGGIIESELGPEEATDGGPGEDSDRRPQAGLRADEMNAILSAHESFSKDVAAIARTEITPLTKSGVDKILAHASMDELKSEMARHYTGQIGDALHARLRETFKASAVEVKTPAEARAAMLKEIAAGGLRDYLISIAVRVIPVIVFGLALGYVLGRAEVGSIGMAGAFAGFLLCWPLLYTWELLVSHNFQDYRALFTGFYILYILAFLLLARTGALFGAALRQSRIRSGAPPPLRKVGASELFANVGLGVMVNGLVYASAVWLPSLTK